MKYLKETTVYAVDYRVPMHTYIMDGTKCVGYIKEGTDEKMMFSKPSVHFSKKGRTFKEIKLC
jgi:hypothetical protein